MKGLWLSGVVFLSMSRGSVFFSGVVIRGKKREIRLGSTCEGRIWASSEIVIVRSVKNSWVFD